MARFFLENLKRLNLKKQYILYAIMYGISSLIIPFTTQYLVNQLSLSAIFANTLSFLFILGFFLALSQVFKYCQIIFNEYIQREIFFYESEKWKQQNNPSKAHYYFEVMGLIKSFSMSFTHLVELALLLFFGMMVIITFHPAFLILLIIISVSIFLITRSWDLAIRTSVKESSAKYQIVENKKAGLVLSDEDFDNYLEKRNTHFYYIKKNTVITGSTFFTAHLYLLVMGLYLIQVDQLSIGQLVSSEIILAGILVSLSNLPKTMEFLYDYETSKIKLKYALEDNKHE